MLVSAIHTATLELVAIDPTAIRYLIEGDRKAAEQVMGVTLPEPEIQRILTEAESVLSSYVSADGGLAFDISAHLVTCSGSS